MEKQCSFIRIYDKEIDPALESIDSFIDNDLLNKVFRYKHSSRLGRKPIPVYVYLRMHILKSIKKISSFNELVGEIKQRKAYRKFCKITSKSKVPCPASLTNFRKGFTFQDRITLMSIFIKKASKLGLFDSYLNLHIIDSTDLVSPCSSKVVGIDENNKEHYRDPTATKGKRASKKWKSNYFVGHKKHTLSVVLPGNKTIALLSLVAPAHQHDEHFLLPLLHIAKAIGLEVNYVVGDVAYIDTNRKRIARNRYGVVVHTDKKVNTKLPMGLSDTGTPECILGIPMRWIGYDYEAELHSYECGGEDASMCMGDYKQ